MRVFAPELAKLRQTFTAVDLYRVCEQVATHWAKANNGKQEQEEMYVFDDQRMGALMGATKLFEKLGVLRKWKSVRRRLRAKTSPSPGKAVFQMGRAVPPCSYELTGKYELLHNVMKSLHDVTVHVKGELTLPKLMQLGKKLLAV